MRKILYILPLVGALFPMTAAHSAEPKEAEPLGNPGTWVTPQDYPPRALREEREGVTGIVLTVGPEGKVAECEVTRPSGYEDLDAMTCMMLTERAEFRPATDAEGNVISGAWASAVRWQIPENSGPSFAPPETWVEYVMIVEKDGRVSECSATSSNEADVVDTSGWCRLGTLVRPILDDEGNPVRKRIVSRFETRHEGVED